MVHGKIMALLISKCPEILMFPDRSGYRFNDYEEVRRVFAILNDIIAYVFCCVVSIKSGTCHFTLWVLYVGRNFKAVEMVARASVSKGSTSRSHEQR
jgi:hypothetical protein